MGDRIEVIVLPAGRSATGRIYPPDVRRKIAEQAPGKFVHTDLNSTNLRDVIGLVVEGDVDEDGAVKIAVEPAGMDLSLLHEFVEQAGLVVTLAGKGKATRLPDGREVLDVDSYDLTRFGLTRSEEGSEG